MATPKFKRLKDKTLQAQLVQLRKVVTPILGGNYLPSFTDHTVTHSDCLCALVDNLTEPLLQSHKLTDQEAFVLYAACYLHDVGLQHQCAETIPTIKAVTTQTAFLGRQWGDLTPETQQKIVRQEHHRISGDMIRQSIDAPQLTVLGIQLTQDWEPGKIISLCVAHCLDTDSEEYGNYTSDSGGFRMGFLSALLRLADICDESHRRSILYLKNTRELDLEAQSHWWRHHYVADIELKTQIHKVVIWFDFPVDRRPHYRELFQSQEIPDITAEFARHTKVLADNGLHWTVKTAETHEKQSTTRPMDDDLELYLAEKLAHRREEQSERDRILVLNQLKASRPTIQRKISNIRANAMTMPPIDQLGEFQRLATHLWNLGGHRDAWTTLQSELHSLSPQLTPECRLEAAIGIAEMMLNDDYPEGALRTLFEFRTTAAALPDASALKYRFFLVLGRSYVKAYALSEATTALKEAARLSSDPTVRATIEAELSEMALLEGKLNAPVPPPGIGGNNHD